ncbi:alkane 1-monooxygenase [Saprospiraceae bacterium]|nr:alkane 1-monooxygenase [Saprospiraceae bacterium]
MKIIQYFAAFIMPLLAFIGLRYGGINAWATVGFAFILLPLVEFLSRNRMPSARKPKNIATSFSNLLFDVLLYLNIPIVYGLIVRFSYGLSIDQYSLIEIVGLIISIGTTLGACGINVAHELSHRKNPWERFLSKVLLIPNLNLHFFIEHHRGHHKNVATPEDPVSSRLNETIYTFYFRSILGQFVHAWIIESSRLRRAKKQTWTIQNEMIRYQLIHILYILILLFFLGPLNTSFIISVAICSFIITETLNYVTHYGMLRKKLDNGKYEPQNNSHSWNANQSLGAIIFYELPLHSDHHKHTKKKYQDLLFSHPDPDLPYGYSTSMVIALIPSLWFKVMNKEVAKYRKIEA